MNDVNGTTTVDCFGCGADVEVPENEAKLFGTDSFVCPACPAGPGGTR